MRPDLADPAPYRVIARNTARASANRIHDDQVARGYGFRAGLVPGANVYEHLSHPLVAAWGRLWLSGGSVRVRLVGPVYEGDYLSIESRVVTRPASGPEVELRAVNAEGTACATASAGFTPAAATLPLVKSFPEAPLPSPPPPASEAAFRDFAVLGSVDAGLSPPETTAYLDSVGEDLPLYRSEGLVPPGHWVASANRLLSSNVVLGPWLHASSEVVHFRPAGQGEPLRMRGRVADLFERGGHRFVEVEALIVASDRRPVAHVRHTAIYEPARRGR